MLPIIKYVIGRLLHCVSAEVSSANTLSIVVVELFDALYLFKCMQSAGSMASSAGLIVVDLLLNVYHLWELRKLAQRVKQHTAIRIAVRSEAHSQPKTLNVQLIHHTGLAQVLKPSVVHPHAETKGIASGEIRLANGTTSPRRRIDKDIQEFLLECEHVVIIEFIECAVPFFYAIYMLSLFYLPNVRFYREMEHVDATRLKHTVFNIATHAMLEFASLLYVHVFLWWEFRISALHLLANVLKREQILLQSALVMIVMIVLQWTVQHNGTCMASAGMTYR